MKCAWIGAGLWLTLLQSAAAFQGAPRAVTLAAGRGTVVDCPEGVLRVSTSRPEVVDAVVASDAEVLFHAKTPGQATLVIWPKGGARRTYEVTVEPDLEALR